jgi:hypothetical protein
MSNFKGNKEQFRHRFGPQDRAKEVHEIAETSKPFFNREFIQKNVEEMRCYYTQFKNSWGPLSVWRLIVHVWKSTTVEDVYIYLHLTYITEDFL